MLGVHNASERVVRSPTTSLGPIRNRGASVIENAIVTLAGLAVLAYLVYLLWHDGRH